MEKANQGSNVKSTSSDERESLKKMAVTSFDIAERAESNQSKSSLNENKPLESVSVAARNSLSSNTNDILAATDTTTKKEKKKSRKKTKREALLEEEEGGGGLNGCNAHNNMNAFDYNAVENVPDVTQESHKRSKKKSKKESKKSKKRMSDNNNLSSIAS